MSDGYDDLLDPCLRGDSRAQHLLARRVCEKLFALIRKHWPAIQELDARAISYEAFAEGLLNLSKFDRKSSLLTWFGGIARNIASDYLKDLGLLEEKEVPLDTAAERSFFRRRPKPSIEAVRDDVIDFLRDFIYLLTPEQAVIVVLRFAAKLTHAQIADRTGKSPKAVGMLVLRLMPQVEKAAAEWREGSDILRNL